MITTVLEESAQHPVVSVEYVCRKSHAQFSIISAIHNNIKQCGDFSVAHVDMK